MKRLHGTLRIRRQGKVKWPSFKAGRCMLDWKARFITLTEVGQHTNQARFRATSASLRSSTIEDTSPIDQDRYPCDEGRLVRG